MDNDHKVKKYNNGKYTQEEVTKIFSEKGLTLLDAYQAAKVPMHCVDADGYEFMTALAGILRGDKPSRFHVKNPFTISNIKKYLMLNGFTCELLSTEYINSSAKLLLKCECGSLFETSWNSIFTSKKNYCNFCAKSKRFDGLRDYTAIVRKNCEEMGYTLLTEYIHRGHDKFEYICNKHRNKGVQTSNYDQMINGHRGCWYCGREAIGKSRRSDEQQFINATQRVGFIYVGVDYDNAGEKYKKARIHYICPHHVDKGVQTIRYNNLLKSHGNCSYCVGHGKTREDVQNELDELNSDIEVLEYAEYSSPAKLRCRICGHIWSTPPMYLIYGKRCPHCSRSRFEIDVSRLLKSWGYDFQEQHVFQDCRDQNPLPFDFYLPDFGVLIETDGEHHFWPVRYGSRSYDEAVSAFEKTVLHDAIKTTYCQQHGLQLIRIPYWERDELEYFLWDRLTEINVIERIAV